MTAEIFEEFRQLGNPGRDRTKGSGLGLAIVAKTATLLGLQIQVRSRPGKGSLFAVELPVGKDLKPVLEHQYTHRPLRIALVEDNVVVATALVYALTNVGHQVVSASSGADLLPLLDGVRPDIIISDYRLSGGEDGYGVIDSLRKCFGDTLPAILITGDTDPAIIRRMAEYQISVQHKPLDLPALQAKIAELTA
jgi:two-component system, sensor histidine kinase